MFRLFTQYISISLGIVCLSIQSVCAQDVRQFMYGTVETKKGDVYEGFIRWDKEEVCWHDIFNSEKTRQSRTNRWGNFDWSLSSIWHDKYEGSGHTFACMFGDIKALEPHRSSVDVILKNDNVIRVSGGSNDIDANINMLDYELGVIRFDWDRIEKITFKEAPLKYRHRYGKVLYGTAYTRRGKSFEGFIKWDNDERCGIDILDGESRNGTQKVPFERIASIKKDGSGSTVVFQSGRSIFMDDSNDVDDGNRGIHVYQSGVGSIEIPWDYFDRVDFDIDPPVGPSYSSFSAPEAITGEVTLFNGEKHYGQMLFDLDEIWDIEVLDGNDDYIKYQIPFRNIRRIIPKNRSYSLVILKNGEELLLGDSQDVSRSNSGIVIVKDKKNDITIDWDDIDVIHFY